MERAKEYIIRFAEIIGLAIFILQIMLKMLMGQNFYDVGFDFAYSTLMVALALRQMNEFFLLITLFMLGLVWCSITTSIEFRKAFGGSFLVGSNGHWISGQPMIPLGIMYSTAHLPY